jgi:hypothetical protein
VSAKLAGPLLALVAGVALVCVLVGWLEEPDPLAGDEAAAAVAAALADAGVAATVDPVPLASTYQPVGGERTEVWQTVASVEGGTILLAIARDGATPLYIDDRSPNGAQLLLSDAQLEVVVAGIEDPGAARLLERNVSLTVGAALVLGVAIALSLRPRPRETP